MNKEKIINNISFVIGVITLILIALFHNHLIISGIAAGVGSVLYGVCIMINRNSSGYLFFSLGLSLSFALILFDCGFLDKGDSVTFMICLSTFLLMAVTLIFMCLNKKEIAKIYSLVVEGEVIDLVKNPNTTKEYYQVIYQYKVGDEVYKVGTPDYINRFIPKLGDKIKIYIDPNDHANTFFEKTKPEKIYNIGLCTFFMIASLIIVITLFI